VRAVSPNQDDSQHPSSEDNVVIAVAEEYMGYVIGQLQARGEIVKEMKVTECAVAIKASLPFAQYAKLA
jgi:translation elongation factor EF-G